MGIKSEAKLTTFEAISMIVGNSIGTGIIAVPYLATKNSMLDVVWMVLLGTKGQINKELAYMQLGESIGKWAVILAGIFSLFALLTTFWSNTLALRDVVHEQVGIGNRTSAYLWQIKAESRCQSNMRCDRNCAFSGTYGYIHNCVGCGIAYSVKLGGSHVSFRKIKTDR